MKRKSDILSSLLILILVFSFAAIPSLAASSTHSTDVIHTFFGLPWETSPLQLPKQAKTMFDITLETSDSKWFSMTGSATAWNIEFEHLFFSYHDDQELSTVLMYFDGDTLPKNKADILSADDFDTNASWTIFKSLLVHCKDEYGQPSAYLVSVQPKMDSFDDMMNKAKLTLDLPVDDELCGILKQLILSNYCVSLSVYFSNVELIYDLTWGQNRITDDDGTFIAESLPYIVYHNHTSIPKSSTTLSEYLSQNIVEKALMIGLDKADFITLFNTRLSALGFDPPAIKADKDGSFHYGDLHVRFDASSLITGLDGPSSTPGNEDAYYLIVTVSVLEFPLEKTSEAISKASDLILRHLRNEEFSFSTSLYSYLILADSFMVL